MTDENDREAGDNAFGERDLQKIEAHAAVRPPVVFEAIRREGQEEMSRPASALALSGVAAGIAMGFSVLAQGTLMERLPESDWRPILADLGYTFGFLIVILGQMQLFTENTITPVCELLERPTRRNRNALLRIWGVVLAANLFGTALFAAAMLHLSMVDAAKVRAMLDLGLAAIDKTFWETLARGVPAGWLIAALVWLSPTAQGSKAAMVVVITYVIALVELTHVVAGSAKAALLVFAGEASFMDAYVGYVLPAVIGNVIGGSALFTLLVWGQIRTELPARADRAAQARRRSAGRRAEGRT